MLEQIIQNSVFSCYSGGWGQVPEGAAPEIGWKKIPVSRGECLLASVSLKLGAPIDLSGFRVSLQLPEDFSRQRRALTEIDSGSAARNRFGAASARSIQIVIVHPSSHTLCSDL